MVIRPDVVKQTSEMVVVPFVVANTINSPETTARIHATMDRVATWSTVVLRELVGSYPIFLVKVQLSIAVTVISIVTI